ncbi:MAG: 2-oxoglutarate dehydrogenase E1 component [Magnetococcales bacterium]|nr:2-oxoglutarate dehydrogenase E1 component [Magnetococcales bacterium]
MSAEMDSFLNGTNGMYVSELYARYQDDPRSIEVSWAEFFANLESDEANILHELKGASWSQEEQGIIGKTAAKDDIGFADGESECAWKDPQRLQQATLDSIRALMLIRTYRVRGHLNANFDPLGIEGKGNHPELDPKAYGFTAADMDRPIFIDYVLGLEHATLNEIMKVLNATYCHNIGVEFMHIQEPDQKSWIQRRIEGVTNETQFSARGKEAILERLTQAEGFEKFLQIKYTGAKRFGLDGGESLIPALEQILKRGGQLGVQECVLGMAHRGRLNVLANVMRKPFKAIFSEFQGGSSNPDDVQGSGDVRYHLGTSSDREFDGNTIHLSLNPNPSHLEIVNPVVLGKVRARQALMEDWDRRKVMGILLHGDAAFPGQGIVPESLALSGLKGYKTGGTIHIIVNNQIGFTTNPSSSRSSPYPSDVAKVIQAPIFHVNGDDPEAVVHVARIAMEFRQEFGQDVVIDMFCYRRHGHNEGDEPAFTQPIMYRTIANHPTTREIYAKRLVDEGVIDANTPDKMVKRFSKELEQAFKEAPAYKPDRADWLEGKWEGLVQLSGEEESTREFDTGAYKEDLLEVGRALSTPPNRFNLNRKIVRLLKNKAKMFETGENIDWATGEALAFGTILQDGDSVRLSGQDCGRGTFSQRHSVLVDQITEAKYRPLNNIRPAQGTYEVVDSPLAEASVMGFEYGVASADPHCLTMWEAQFGDFVNGAQMIIDQFLSSGESKWLRLNGLVLLLPHGYEGQGPEHSSARPERFLQLCAEDNMQICNLTTPANYFHALRRQLSRNFRKPLVIFTPKSLLRHKLCVSKLDDFTEDTTLKRVIGEVDDLVSDKKVKRVVLCTGKVYYDLLMARREQKIDHVALVRIEQLYPWPRNTVYEIVRRYKNAELYWCQEEPANMGAWSFIYPRLEFILEDMGNKKQLRPHYAGRKASASPATGLASVHAAEQKQLVEQALTGKSEDLVRPFSRLTPMAVLKK